MARQGRLTALLTASACALAVLTGGSAAADVSSTPTDFPAVKAIAVDEAHNHVFVTGAGNGGFDVPLFDYVQIFDLAGRPVGTIDGLAGAYGLALNGTGTKLYVSLFSEQAIAVIDTATLTETARIDVATCPEDLAIDSGVLAMTTDCDDDGQWQDVIAMDLGTEAQTNLGSYFTPGVAAAAGRLAVSDLNLSNTDVAVYDLTQADVPLVKTRFLSRAAADVAITPDGAHVLLTGYGDGLSQYAATDLAREVVYEASASSVSTAVVGPTTYVVAAGGDKTGAINVFELGVATEVASAPVSKVYGDMEITDDISRAFISTGGGSAKDQLSVVYDLLDGPSTLIADVDSTARLDSPIELRGKLALSTGDSPAGSVVEIRRHNPSGFSILGTATVGAKGWFQYTDTATDLGDWRYDVVYDSPGDAASAADNVELTVVKKAAPLTFTVSDQRVRAGQSVALTAKLAAGPTERTVKIKAEKVGGGSRLVEELTLSPGDATTVRYTVQANTTLTAYFDGDDEYAPRAIRRGVKAEVRIDQEMRRWDDRRNGTYLYQTTDEPWLHVKVSPSKRNKCMEYHFQAKRASGWKWLAYVECYELNRRSIGGVIYTTKGERRTDTLYRVRSAYPGDKFHVETTGDWEYFRFTR